MNEEAIQERIAKARETNTLDLSGVSNLDKVPVELFSLQGLKSLSLKGHRLQYLPEEIFGLEALEELNLTSDNAAPGLQRLPDRITGLKNLRKLNLSHNALQDLPVAICHLNQLEILSLNDNHLRELPEDIGCLVEIEELFLSGNRLQSLPDSLGKLNNLVGLYLQHNQLTQLPSTIGNLNRLERLNLSYNQLSDIPLSLRKPRRLKFFDLRHNPLLEEKKYPPEIYAQFNLPSVILRDLEIQYEDLEEHMEPLAEAKLVLLGDGNVGKTTLVNQLVYDVYKEPEGTTKGVNISAWELPESENLRLNIWDFAGQAIMHATHQLFLTKHSIYLVVLNARQEVQEERLFYWLNVIMSFAGDKAKIIVVINGLDQNRLYLDQRGLRNMYSIRDFIETSATRGDGIETLRGRIIDLARKEVPTVKKKVKLSWKTARKLVEKQISNLNLESMTWEEFEKICETRRITDKEEQETLLGTLHEMGVVFSPKDHGGKIGDRSSILNPDQLTKSIYELQSNEKTLEAQRDDGRISPDELENILTEIKMMRAHWKLLKPIMQHHDLCIELNNGNLVFTRLLPVEEPILALAEDNPKTRFTYRYNFLPESVLPRFIGTLSRSESDETVIFKELWQRGVYLQIGPTQLLMRIKPEAKRVDLMIFGDKAVQRKRLLERFRNILGQAHDQIAYLKVEQFVPVTNEKGDEQLIPFDHLLTLQMAGQEKFIPYGSHRLESVQSLLESIEHRNWQRRQLRELIAKFNLEELRTLCFDLGVDYENIPNHQTLEGFSREIILYMERRGRMEELVTKCRQERPNFQWSAGLLASGKEFRSGFAGTV